MAVDPPRGGSPSASLAPAAALTDSSGARVELSRLVKESGGLPLLVVLFKTTCPTCKLAWPYVQKLHAAYGGRAVRVIGVSQDDLAASQRFYAEHGDARFELFLDPQPYPASTAFDVESVPHLALVEPDGTLALTTAGWSRTAFEELGAHLAERGRVAPVPIVAPDDPVPDWKPG
jgi:peroxiredoxin